MSNHNNEPKDENLNSSEEDVSSEESNEANAVAVFSYMGLLLIIPVLAAKEDPFVKFHIKQGLVLLLSFMAVELLVFIPILGWLLIPIVFLMLGIFTLIGIVNALRGVKKELPIIGKYANKFNL